MQTVDKRLTCVFYLAKAANSRVIVNGRSRERVRHQYLRQCEIACDVSAPDLNASDYSVLEILQEKVCKTCIADLDELKQLLRMEWAKLAHVSSLQQPFVNGVVDSCRSVLRVLYTSLAIFPTRCN